MPLGLPFRSPTPPPPALATAADLTAVGVRLDAVATALEAHYSVTAAQGEAIAHLPAALLDHLRGEVRDMARDMARAAWVAAKSEALERGFRWGIRVALGSVTLYGLSWVHSVLAWAQGGGK